MENIKNITDNIYIRSIRSVTKVNLAQGTRSAMRTARDGNAISIKKCGSTVYRQNGKKTVSDSTHAVFLPKGATYLYDIIEAGECVLFELELEGPSPFSEITSIPLPSGNDIWLSAEKAEKHWTYKKSGYRNKCLSCIYDILSRVQDSKSYTNSGKYRIIKPSLTYLESNLSDPDMDTSVLASISGISVPYFRKLFYELYGMPVAKYIETIRIGKACDLLKTDVGSVGYIAEISGYRNIYHFSKTFKKVVGVSPAEYRNGSFE